MQMQSEIAAAAVAMRTPPQSAPGVHDAILELLSGVGPGALLDLGCGRGELTRKLCGLGRFRVTAIDLTFDPGIEGITFCKRDLEQPFELQPGSFDVVVSTEVIEHLRDPFAFLRRAAEMLRPGGTLVVSTPNVEGIASRLWFLRHGRLINFTDTDLAESGHIHPLAYWQIEHVLAQHGLTVESVSTTRYQPAVRSLGDRLFLLACEVARFALRPPRPGNILVVRARKVGAAT
jgi:2-polyprenyl-3-methyl-5-hydroxy-6-metoxy-1,4-benzoquinol methylase